VERCREFESELYKYAETMNPALLQAIEQKKVLDDQIKGDMVKAITELKERFVETTVAAGAAK
jgi:F0F1-type ATP synthase alpha subunit